MAECHLQISIECGYDRWYLLSELGNDHTQQRIHGQDEGFVRLGGVYPMAYHVLMKAYLMVGNLRIRHRDRIQTRLRKHIHDNHR